MMFHETKKRHNSIVVSNSLRIQTPPKIRRIDALNPIPQNRIVDIINPFLRIYLDP